MAVLLLALFLMPLFSYGTQSAGTADDPLATLSYAINVFLPKIDALVGTKSTAEYEKVLIAASNKGQNKVDSLSSSLTTANLINSVKSGVARSITITNPAPASKSYRTVVLFKGDRITGPAGVGIILRSGSARNSGPAGGVLINVNAGRELAPGSSLAANIHYILSEKSGCTVTVTSDTAVLMLSGRYTVTPEIPLYGAKYTDLAYAMKRMNMLAGSNRGFELSKTLNRAEGAVMLARLLGVEAEAARATAPIPFTDVPSWAFPFVSYAYHNGLLYGKTATQFDAAGPLTKEQYVTMVLRALGYADTGENPDFIWNQSLAKAVETGLLTQNETSLISNGPFYRDYMVYVSYYALDAQMKNAGNKLLDFLIARNVTDYTTANEARAAINRRRP